MSERQTDKHEKFRELAEARTNRALESITRIGKLSNKQFYQWEDHEVRKVLKALRDAVNDVESRFESPKGRGQAKFRF